MPAMSMVRNVALFGRPMTGPVIASISSMVQPPSASCARAAATPCRPMRLPMKPGASRAATTPFPSCRLTNDVIAATAAGSVSGVGTTSTRRR